MKLIYNSCTAWLCIAVLSISNVLAQSSQLIPFQGTLYDQGTALTGAVNITFTIADPAWTETHTDVAVVQGLYSVVLGETTAFPEDLFVTGDTPELTVSIGGTEVATVPLYAPYISEGIVANHMPASITRTFDEDASEHNALAVTAEGTGAGQTAAIEGVAQSTTYNTGVEGFALSTAGNAESQNGMFGSASGTGTGSHRGVYGVAQGAGKYNYGLKGNAQGTGNGDEGFNYGEGSVNFGVEGTASGNSWNNTGVEGSNYGTSGKWNFGVHGISNAGTGTEVENTGVAGRAYGSGKNVGVYGTAGNGDENWAGIFDGDVNVNGQLMVNGQPISAGGSGSAGEYDSVLVKNTNGEVRGKLTSKENGGLTLYDELDEKTFELMSDETASHLFMYNDKVKTPNGDRYPVFWMANRPNDTYWQQFGIPLEDDPDWLKTGAAYQLVTGNSAAFTLETGNRGKVYMEAKEEYGTFSLFAQDWKTNIEMGAKFWENTNGTQLPYFKMLGSVESDDGQGGTALPDLVWINAVHDENDGSEFGEIGLNSTNGSSFLVNTYGLSFGQNAYDNGIVMNHDQTNGGVFEMYNGSTAQVFLNGSNGDASFSGQVFANSFGTPKAEIQSNWGSGGQGALILKDGNDNWRFQASVDDDGSSNYWGNLNLSNSENGDHLNIDGYGNLSANGDNDQSVKIRPGGIEWGYNSYSNGIVMNYDDTGGAILEMYSGDASTINMNGNSGHINTVSLAQSSDARFKKNVKSIDGALAKTQQLNGYTYHWNKLAEKQKGITSKEEQVGVLAQELEAVFPQLVKTDEEGYKSVNYAALTAVLIEAVKELSSEVGHLKTENTALKAELTQVGELAVKMELIEKLLAKQALQANGATVSR